MRSGRPADDHRLGPPPTSQAQNLQLGDRLAVRVESTGPRQWGTRHRVAEPVLGGLGVLGEAGRGPGARRRRDVPKPDPAVVAAALAAGPAGQRGRARPRPAPRPVPSAPAPPAGCARPRPGTGRRRSWAPASCARPPPCPPRPAGPIPSTAGRSSPTRSRVTTKAAPGSRRRTPRHRGASRPKRFEAQREAGAHHQVVDDQTAVEPRHLAGRSPGPGRQDLDLDLHRAGQGGHHADHLARRRSAPAPATAAGPRSRPAPGAVVEHRLEHVRSRPVRLLVGRQPPAGAGAGPDRPDPHRPSRRVEQRPARRRPRNAPRGRTNRSSRPR